MERAHDMLETMVRSGTLVLLIIMLMSMEALKVEAQAGKLASDEGN